MFISFLRVAKEIQIRTLCYGGNLRLKKWREIVFFFEKFSPYPEDEWIRVDIRKILDKKWGSGTFCTASA